MTVRNAPASIRSSLVCFAALVGIFITAPWPSIQSVFHVALVLGYAPLESVPLVAGLWAVAAGWVAEVTLRMVPHPGGAAWVDLTLTLTVLFFNRFWPPDRRLIWWGRLAGFTLLHSLLLYLAMALASGSHPVGRGWLWALLTSPFWAMLAWRVKPAAHPR